MQRKLFTKRDIIVFAAIALLVVAFILLVPGEKGGEAEIWVDGEMYRSYPLSRRFELTLDNGVSIEGDGESVWFVSSDCTDKVCVNTGKLSVSGEWAACLPNSTVLKITKGDGGVDIVS